MSTDTPPPDPFDELDQLLKRMLALPVHQFDEPDATGETLLTPAITIAEAGLAPLPAYEVPLPPFSATRDAIPESPPAAPPPAPPVPAPLASSPVSTPVTAPGTAPVAPPPPPAPAPAPALPWALRPLQGANFLFDRATLLLGPLGRGLRQPAGKTLLGWTGLVLLAAAGGLAMYDWFRWTR